MVILSVKVFLCFCVIAETHLLLAIGGEGGIRPVDIAIGDGKNVSVNVTALSVPFSRTGSSPQAARHAGNCLKHRAATRH